MTTATATPANGTSASHSNNAAAAPTTATPPAQKATVAKATASKPKSTPKSKTVPITKSHTATAKEGKTAMKVSKINVTISKRAVRTGVRMPYKQFLDTIGNTTKTNLETLTKKFGISWEFVVDAKAPKESTGPKRPFVVCGKADKVKVFYDRSQLSLFVNGHKERIADVIKMNKKQFEKLAEAS